MNVIQGKEVGTIKTRKGLSTNGANTNDFHLLALADSKNEYMILIS